MTKCSELENAYALIIGISNYKDPKIPKLNYTHADAECIFKLLTDPKRLGLSKDKIKLLLDEDATRFNIKNAIISWLFKNVDKDSVVFIFFAGYGGLEEDRLGIEKDNLAKYLLPYDTILEDFYSSALSNRDFNELLLTIKSKKLVIFIDSRYTGGVSERKARDVKITDDPYQNLAEGEGRIVIAASQPNQCSFEDSRIGHGVFTHNLLEALSGKADLDNDGYVTVLDAYKYLQDAVPRDAMKLAGGKQEPILRGDITKDFVISISHERHEEIEKEREIEAKLAKLREFYCAGKFSGKLYEKLHLVAKTDVESLQQKDKDLAKLINDLCSGDILIDTFLEDIKDIEPDLHKKSKKEIEEPEICMKEVKTWEKEGYNFKKKDIEQKPEKELPQEKVRKHINISDVLIEKVFSKIRKIFGKKRKEDEEKNGRIILEDASNELTPVLLGVSAPQSAKPNDVFTARFVAYIKAAEGIVEKKLSELSYGRSETHLRMGSCQWQLDTRVTVKLSGRYLKVNPSKEEFVWKGYCNLVNFVVEVLPDAPEEWSVLCYEVLVDGFRVAFIPLDLEITSKILVDKRNTATAKPARTAFASYASQDRSRVLDRVAAVRICAGLDIFMDCLSLHPGDEWKPRLEQEIKNRDLFLLFWSLNARKSEWVTWEWKTALSQKDEFAMQLHPLQTVTKAPPPEELRKLYFGDVYMLVRDVFNSS